MQRMSSSPRSTSATARRWLPEPKATARSASTSTCRGGGRRSSLPFDALFVPDSIREAVSGRAWLETMLEAERALAVAEAHAGVIPTDASAEIAKACDATHFDFEEIAAAGRPAANPVEPLVRALRDAVGGDAARYVHWGATSQDVLDTASMLVARRSLGLTLAALGEKGPEVLKLFANELGLAEPAVPWHTVRVRIGELGGALDLAAGACAKIALDVTLLAQTEVAEVSTGDDGRSSTMPHKRNPASAVLALACARQAHAHAGVLTASLVQEHERAAGGWQAEWAA